MTAQPLDTYHKKSDADLIEHVCQLVIEKETKRILVGLPINMDGSHGFKADEVKAFVAQLEDVLEVPVELWDERLTSWEAEQHLAETGRSVQKERKKGSVDRIAAQLLLKSYLDAHREC